MPASIGKYEIRSQIGRGAMGVVYEAFDSVIERRVAIKMLLTEVFDPAQLADVRVRFKREAHSAGRLSHPSIVTIFDYGEHEGTPYIVMDLMTGEELSRRLDSGARLPLAEVVRIMEQLLGALAYAHESGVIHRDIKPSNIFVLRDGSLKVVDFGIARIESSELTETGAILGTPAYMSPEQFLGLPVDARSDLFSAGVILYQLLTGDRPFTGSPTTIMQKVLRQDPVEPSVLNPTLSADWDTVVKRALAKKPDQRFGSARQFADAARLVFEGNPLPEAVAFLNDATVRIAGARPRPRRARTLALAGAALAAIAVGGVAMFLYRPQVPAPVAAVPAVAAPKAKPAEDESAAAKALAAKKRGEAERRAALAAQQKAKVEAERRAALEAQQKAQVEAERRAAAERPSRRARAEAERARRAEAAKLRAEKAAPKPAPAEVPITQAKAAPAPVPSAPAPPYRGKVVSLERDWGFVIVESANPGAVRLGDRLYATLADGRRVEMVVRRISGNLVSAVPEGKKLSDELLGAAVSQK
jgi:serine/threonine-protein kinase